MKAPFFTSTIAYPATASEQAKTGKLVYVKSSLIEEMDFPARGYWAANPTFPHQSTVDQFFDPIQFEAYRQLGYRCMARSIDETELGKVGAAGPDVIAGT